MKAGKNIIIERQSAWMGSALPMPVVISDEISLNLMNGDVKEINLPSDKTECDIQAKDHLFHITNVKDIKKIVFKYNFSGISCLVIYKDGHEFNALNKNSGVTVKNTIWLIILLFFVILPISLCLLGLIITGGINLFDSALDSGVNALF